MLFISPFTPPFTLIEEAFVIGCFRGWEAKFTKSISTKKTYTPFAQISSREKRLLTCSTKINSGEKDFLVYSAKWKFPRKNISPKINTTSYAKKVLIHLRNTFLSSQTINMFFNPRFLLGINCSISKRRFDTTKYIHSK